MILDKPYITKKDRRRVITGLVMTLIGGFLFFYFPSMLNGALKSQLQVKEGNDFTKAWNKNPFPISLDVYVFNLENPEEFASGAKAKLREMGPYSYNMWLYKEIIAFNGDQTKVRFWESQSFEFRDDSSPNKLSDKVTILNFPVYALANMVRAIVTDLPLSFALQPVAIGFVNILFMTHSESLIKELTVGELLNGYPFSILNTIDAVTRPLTWFGIQLPDTGMPDNKFGLLWTKNFTKGGPFEAYSGQKGTQLLKLISFKDQSTLNFYDEPRCNMINGTEGSTFEMDVSKEKTYYVFTTDTCRTFDLTYEKDTWVNGIPTYRFIPNPKLFAAPSKNPDNRCYCRTPEQEEWCDGIFDLGRCLNGAPAAYSFPHFLGASNTLRNNVENMQPDPEKHQAFIDVEPFMGSPIRGAEKLQMNAIIKPIPYLAGFRNFRDSVLPLMWMRKGAVINDEFTLKLRLAIWPLYLILFLIYAVFFGGILILGTVGYRLYRKRSQIQLNLNSVASIDSKRSESREPLQVDFNKDIATPSPPPAPATQTPAAQVNQPLQQHSANYSAISRRPGPLQPRQSISTTNGYPDDRISLMSPVHTAQYRATSQQAYGPALSRLSSVKESNYHRQSRPMVNQRVAVPADQIVYPRLSYSNTTQAPRISRMSVRATGYGSMPAPESQPQKRAPIRVEPPKQAPYPRLSYSSITQGPRVGQASAASSRYGPTPVVERNNIQAVSATSMRRNPLPQADTTRAAQQVSEQQLRPLPEDELYNEELDIDSQIEAEMPDYNYDNVASTWTSVNEIIHGQAVEEKKKEIKEEEDEGLQAQPDNVESLQNNKVKKANVEERVTWSPPGSIE